MARHGCSEPNLGPLEEHYTLLTTESSLLSNMTFLKIKFNIFMEYAGKISLELSLHVAPWRPGSEEVGECCLQESNDLCLVIAQ